MGSQWPACSGEYDLEESEARMVLGVLLVVAETEHPFAILEGFGANCPPLRTRRKDNPGYRTIQTEEKKVELALMLQETEGRQHGKIDPIL